MDAQMHTGFRGLQFAHSNKGNGASVGPTADWVVRSAMNSTRIGPQSSMAARSNGTTLPAETPFSEFHAESR